MEISQLKHIQAAVAVAKYSSFSLAAVELSFTASAISKQVASLEHSLGLRLFNRNASSLVSLTPEGEFLLPRLQAVMEQYENLENAVQLLKESTHGTLHVSTPPALGNWGEDRLLIAFYHNYPEISICYHTETGFSLIHKLAQGTIDICTYFDCGDHFHRLVTESHMNPKVFGCLFIQPCPLLLAFSSQSPLASQKEVDLRAFQDSVFLMKKYHSEPDKASGTILFKNFCHQMGFDPRIQFSDGQKRSLVFSQVADGLYVCPLLGQPEAAYPGVVIRPVRGSKNYAQKKLIYSKTNPSSALKLFLSCAKKELARSK